MFKLYNFVIIIIEYYNSAVKCFVIVEYIYEVGSNRLYLAIVRSQIKSLVLVGSHRRYLEIVDNPICYLILVENDR